MDRTAHSSLHNPSLKNNSDAPPSGGLFRRDSFSLWVPRAGALAHSLLVLFRKTLPKGNELRESEAPMTTTTACCDGTSRSGHPNERCTEHYQVPEYIVPVDPMDDLQCDSCQ